MQLRWESGRSALLLHQVQKPAARAPSPGYSLSSLQSSSWRRGAVFFLAGAFFADGLLDRLWLFGLLVASQARRARHGAEACPHTPLAGRTRVPWQQHPPLRRGRALHCWSSRAPWRARGHGSSSQARFDSTFPCRHSLTAVSISWCVVRRLEARHEWLRGLDLRASCAMPGRTDPGGALVRDSPFQPWTRGPSLHGTARRRVRCLRRRPRGSASRCLRSPV